MCEKVVMNDCKSAICILIYSDYVAVGNSFLCSFAMYNNIIE